MALLIFILISALIIPAQAAASEPDKLFTEGWEYWSVAYTYENGVANYEMICPEINASIERLQKNVLEIMAYCRTKNPAMPSQITIRFPYDGVSATEVAGLASAAFNAITGLRALTNTFLNISRIKLRSGDTPEAILILDVNNPNTSSIYVKEQPLGLETLNAARQLAKDIRAKTNDTRKQLELLNDYIIKHVEYDHNHLESGGRAYSSLGALVYGKATCSGYTNVVADVCYQLNIPCYQITDNLNSHIWNVVKIDGTWLMLDTTFNDTAKRSRGYFLAEDFNDEDHLYTPAQVTMLAGYADALWQAETAADKLRANGIVQGDGNSYAISEALTYEALAVTLTRLSGAEKYVSDNSARLSAVSANSGCAAWAAPYVGYCIEKQYYDASLFTGVGMSLTVEGTQEILRDYYAADPRSNRDTLKKSIYSEEWTDNGTILLRGDFFEMLERCI